MAVHARDIQSERVKELGPFTRFNHWVADHLGPLFGSMAFFWACCIWALLPLFPQLQQYSTAILYISAGFVQLVALPLLAVLGNMRDEKADSRAEATYQNSEDAEMLLHYIITLLESEDVTPD